METKHLILTILILVKICLFVLSLPIIISFLYRKRKVMKRHLKTFWRKLKWYLTALGGLVVIAFLFIAFSVITFFKILFTTTKYTLSGKLVDVKPNHEDVMINGEKVPLFERYNLLLEKENGCQENFPIDRNTFSLISSIKSDGGIRIEIYLEKHLLWGRWIKRIDLESDLIKKTTLCY